MDKKYKFITEDRNLCEDDIIEIKEWLKKNNINKQFTVPISDKKYKKYTLIEIAINNRAIKVVEFLIKEGANLYTCSDQNFNNLIEFCASYGYLDSIKCLLSNGFDNKIFLNDNSLIYAAINNFPKVIEYLIDVGKNIEQFFDSEKINRHTYTALRMAVQENSIESVKLLCELGANVNMQGFDTPLYCASGEGHFEIVKILISYGADVNLGNDKGTTPYEIAKAYKHFEIANYLLEHGAKAN